MTAATGGVGGRAGFVLAVIVSCQLMIVLDATVVNVALPPIQRDLGFSATGLSWVVNAYTLAFGGLLLLGGRLSDAFGRRRDRRPSQPAPPMPSSRAPPSRSHSYS